MFGAVDAEVGIQNAPAEVAHYFVVNRLAGQHQRVRDSVRLHQTHTQGDKHLAHHRFARRDASR